MTAATLFSGIGAPEVAMPEWDWIWHAEIEKFPAAVMAERHPLSVNLGDVTADDFCERALAIGRPDVLVFGSPCQAFSVAGRRLGLDDPRGNLALVALGIVARLEPTWFVFENVPGLLSSSDGRDFGLFLRTVDDLRYHLGWTHLDAQYFGVAQRRRRLFAVGHARDWRGPAAVLLEPESLCGHPPTRGEAREDVTGTLRAGSGGGCGPGPDEAARGMLIAPTLRAGGNRTGGDRPPGTDVDTVESLVVARALTTSNQRIDYETETLIAHSLRADGFDASEDGTGRGTPLVPVAYAIGSHAGAADGDQTNRSHAKGGPVGLNISEEVGYAVRAGRPPAVAFDARQSDVIQYGDKTGPLDTDGQTIGVLTSGVRRLTPRECERLQGLPDDYTLITYRGKPAADGPRYKAIGNSMAVPVVRWILSRLAFMDAFQRQQERQTA